MYAGLFYGLKRQNHSKSLQLFINNNSYASMNCTLLK